MARSSPAEGRRGPHGIQIDTTDSGQKSKHYPPLIGDPRSANRTVVTFHQYTDTWDTPPRYSVISETLRPEIAEATRYYRLAFRDIAQATNERTMIACIAPPGVVF